MTTDPLAAARSFQDKFKDLHTKAVDEATQSLRDDLAQLARVMSGAWIDAFGDLDAVADDADKLAAFVKAAKAHVPRAPAGTADVIRRAVADAHGLAVAQAMKSVPGGTKEPVLNYDPHPAAKTVSKVDSHLKQATLALTALSTGSTYSDATSAAGIANSAVTALTAGLSWQMTDTADSAVSEVAANAGFGWIVVGERNACLDCTNMIGHTDQDGVGQPPYHPHCVCVIQPYNRAARNASSFADGLVREAQRSVARGWSDYDSNAARVRAADSLLQQAPALPKSVLRVARTAVNSGSFQG